jgi:hypothetical protein
MSELNKYQKENRQYRRCTSCNQIKLRESFIKSKCSDCQPAEKECTKCKITKPLSDFHNSKAVKDGKTSMCKECHKKPSTKYIVGSLEDEVKTFFASMNRKLTPKEIEMSCLRLKESSNPLKTLSLLEKEFKVGPDKYREPYLPPARVVEQYTLEWIFIDEYHSVNEASRAVIGSIQGTGNISASALSNGERVAYGYRWKYS